MQTEKPNLNNINLTEKFDEAIERLDSFKMKSIRNIKSMPEAEAVKQAFIETYPSIKICD